MPGKVYIIGAGASFSDTQKLKVGLPLARGFFNRELIDRHWLTANNTDFLSSDLVKVISHYFDVDLEALNDNIWDINIEDVYSFLETAINIYPNVIQYDRLQFRSALEQLVRYIAAVIYYIPFNMKDSEFHSYIASNLSKQDTVVSFNWDLLLENHLWSDDEESLSILIKNQIRLLHDDNYLNLNSHAYDSARERLHEGVLLKMHGSVNFGICSDNSCNKSESPIIFKPFDAEDLYSWTCPSCGSPIERYILPPHVNKTYEPRRFLRLQARIAAQKLSMAEEIIVAGYSFPIYDMEALSMMRLARNDMLSAKEGGHWLSKVTIVDPMTENKGWLDYVLNIFGMKSIDKNYGEDVEIATHSSISEFIASQN